MAQLHYVLRAGQRPDSLVLQVNGVDVAGWGIGGPGTGTFAFSAAGPFMPFSFNLSWELNSTPGGVLLRAPFVVGSNTIRLYHNDTGNGIAGGQFSGMGGQLRMDATITYELAAPVPEPESWAMLLAGGGFLAAALGRRRRNSTAPA